jgi:hypothetical protein
MNLICSTVALVYKNSGRGKRKIFGWFIRVSVRENIFYNLAIRIGRL